jgi:RNA polymerase sigma factor (sigma-70 family)
LERYQRPVYGIARSQGLSAEDAADLTQSVFIILLQSLDRLPEDSNLGGWLRVVTQRQAWRMLRQKRRELTGRLDDVAASPELLGERAPDLIARWELLSRIDAALRRLSKRCRELIRALYLDRQRPAYAEVAEELNMPVGSIGPTRARCLKRLRDLLA